MSKTHTRQQKMKTNNMTMSITCMSIDYMKNSENDWTSWGN